MPAKYDLQKNIFQDWSLAVANDDELKVHLESAIKKVLTEYDTKIYENRFVAGGVIEYLILAAINGSGIAVGKHIGITEQGADIMVESYKGNPCSEKFSIKYSSSNAVRMRNVLGESVKAEWNESTLFVLPEIGVIYANPTHIPKGMMVREADVIKIKRKGILLHAKKHPELVLNLDIPEKKDLAAKQTTKTASEEIAHAIVKKFPRLKL